MQVFIIGNNLGIGIQGAVYKYQITEYGIFFFPITREIVFALNGTYGSKTGLSVFLWFLGSLVLALTTIYSCIHVDDSTDIYYHQIMTGLIAACVIYLGSCIVQYGLQFHGPAGMSFPFGIVLIMAWMVIIHLYEKTGS